MVSDAIAGGNAQAINYFIAQKYVEAVSQFATSPNSKTILFPVEATQAVIEKVYRFCGIPLSDESRARMLEWNDNNPKDMHGRHAYSLVEYGYSEERLQAVFADYIDFLDTLEK